VNPGFSETGAMDFAVGSVTGARWWKIDPQLWQWSVARLQPEQPPLEPSRLTALDPFGNYYPSWTPMPHASPSAQEAWARGRAMIPAGPAGPRPAGEPLTGAWGPWRAGINEAQCKANYSVLIRKDGKLEYDPPHLVPADNCGCGFWAYWELKHAPVVQRDVAGIIEGSGRVTYGPLGFRCQKARIIAFHLNATIDSVNNSPADKLAALEWKTSMEDLLAEHYGARCWTSLDAMLAHYPPDPAYAAEAYKAAQERAARLREASARACAELTSRLQLDAEAMNEMIKSATLTVEQLQKLFVIAETLTNEQLQKLFGLPPMLLGQDPP
jgi:hypothetical protein